MSSQKQHNRYIKNIVNNIKYNREVVGYKDVELDKLDKGQLLDAAMMQLKRAVDREKPRDMMATVKAYEDYKTKNKYIDLTEAERPVLDPAPPKDWPLTLAAWEAYNHDQTLYKAAALIAAEIERLQRQHQHLYHYGVTGLDHEQVERLKKSVAAGRKVRTKNYRRASQLVSDTAYPIGGVTSGGAFADSCSNTVQEALLDDLINNSMLPEPVGAFFDDEIDDGLPPMSEEEYANHLVDEQLNS